MGTAGRNRPYCEVVLATILVYTRDTFGPSVSSTLDAPWPSFLVLVDFPALLMVLWPESGGITKPPME